MTVLILGLGAASGCAPATPPPRISLVTPSRAFTDGPVVLRVEAGRLRPSLLLNVESRSLKAELATVRIKLMAAFVGGMTSVPLETVDWDGENAYWAQVRAGLAAGPYALELVDPQGQRDTISDAFVSLGVDPAPPRIQTVPPLRPDSILGEEKTISGDVVANDGPGAVEAIQWETSDGASGDCRARLQRDGDQPDYRQVLRAELRCAFRFSIPPFAPDDEPIRPFWFRARARDVAGHEEVLEIPLRVARRPVIVSFAASVGALGGYQPFVVRGRNFLPGSTALIDGVEIIAMSGAGIAAGAAPSLDPPLDDGIILGWTPPRNRAGTVPVQVLSEAGLGTSSPASFTYMGPPSPREVQPAAGPRTGGIRITVRGNDLRQGATVYVGSTREARQQATYPHYDPPNTIVACLPPGSGKASIWIYDPITGDGELAQTFTYEDEPSGGVVPNLDPACR